MAEIDINNHEQLRAFLDGIAEMARGHTHLTAFATRSALRAIPLFHVIADYPDHNHVSLALQKSFGACQAAWVAALYPHVSGGMTGQLLASASRATAGLPSIVAATNTAAHQSHAAHYAYQAAKETLSSMFPSEAKVWAEYRQDLSQFHERAGKRLAELPLWSQGMPENESIGWGKIKTALSGTDEKWGVWTDWYDARLRGGPTHPELSLAANERIEVARVLEIKDEDWKQGPALVNSKIKAIIERETQKDRKERYARKILEEANGDAGANPQRKAIPPNNAASARTTWTAEQQKAFLDTSSVEVDVEVAASIAELQALREAIERLCKRLDDVTNSNFDQGGAELLRDTIQAIPDHIPSSVELFAIIIREIVHERYHATVVEQWPNPLRAAYEGVSISLTAALDLFPERRQRRRVDWSAKLEDLAAADVKGALEDVSQVLKSEEGQTVVDSKITDIIDTRVGQLPDQGDMSNPVDRATAVDGFESFHNTIKTLARNAPEKIEVHDVLFRIDEIIVQEADAYEEGVREGVRDGLKKAGKVSGLARIGERAGKSIWDRMPGFGWVRSRVTGSKELDPRVGSTARDVLTPKDDDR